ncbi:pilus assembly PilX N-terminal domain-containing protein [Deinococcus ruber]|uniref:Type 4 fimbrial biogenesis protein PilX N-terminal domain-containing protein n=1 Tax=Deinococcus ruber TaxID=1848197 RepID=A0A918CJH3_9DEIO|nr:pilus assembly PilX N-terminal domain-containing protein [Deinococcus ruber]GGR26668.1 hypothetical protein GCM10008957_42670 [Deinococcus ruber]
MRPANPSLLLHRAGVSAGFAHRQHQGVAIVTVLIFAAVLMVLLASYVTMTLTESRTLKASANGTLGFYSAEAGLNLRAELVRSKFIGYLRPIGTGPASSTPCTPGDTSAANLGSGDMACITYHNLNGRDVVTYMTDVTNYDASGNPESGTVGPGDVYVGLNYVQYAYQVSSITFDPATNTKVAATLQMKFQSRLVPLFQFAAFYKDDLEFHPGPAMTLNGRVHTNANLYLNSGLSLDINGKTTATGKIFHWGKDGRDCSGSGNDGTVKFFGTLMQCTGTSNEFTDSQLAIFNKNVQSHQQALTVPAMSTLNPDTTGSSELWSKADLRVVAVKVPVSGTYPQGFRIEARQSNGTADVNATNALNVCNALPGTKMIDIRAHLGANISSGSTDTTGFWDNREGKWLTVMDVNQTKLMDCIHLNALTGAFRNPAGGLLDVNDTTGGGMAWHFSFDDGNAATNGTLASPTNYAVEVSSGSCIGITGACTDTSLMQTKGLTLVTNQPIFVRGNYNDVNKKPAAILADAVNILSTSVVLGTDIKYVQPSGGYIATPTTVNAAFLSGIDTTTSANGYNGGLQNYPRFHENWSNIQFTYRGSFVSLGNSTHTQGPQKNARYSAPNRQWDYDTAFNDVNNLPPLTPRFVYLRQLLFARTY